MDIYIYVSTYLIENKHPDLNNVNIGVLDVTIGEQL